jgi:ribosomal protein L35AE/L33A
MKITNSFAIQSMRSIAGFESTSTTANEPESESESSVVEIPVIRRDGSRGVVAVQWVAKLNGRDFGDLYFTG